LPLAFQEDIGAIFKKADKGNSGTLTVKEFQAVMNDICERYPQVELYLKNKQMRNIADLLKEAKGDVQKESIELNIEELKTALSKVDSQMKFLPATAQVHVMLFRSGILCNSTYTMHVSQLFEIRVRLPLSKEFT
jgi:hypothetical protein